MQSRIEITIDGTDGARIMGGIVDSDRAVIWGNADNAGAVIRMSRTQTREVVRAIAPFAGLIVTEPDSPAAPKSEVVLTVINGQRVPEAASAAYAEHQEKP